MKKKNRPIVPIIFMLAVFAASVPLIRVCRHNASLYREALQFMQTGERDEAYRLFRRLGRYRDSEQRMTELTASDSSLPYRFAEKGDTVSFGHWEQDGIPENGPEPIDWIVLDKIDGQLLLLSSLCLEGKAYNKEPFTPVTWETCSLRAWLNGEFVTSAFTEEERRLIPPVINENPDHSTAETPGGRDTEDLVFLLCERDTVIYLKDEFDRQTLGTAPASEAARACGLQISEEGFASWWLRSPGMYEYIAQFVDQTGSLYSNGASTDIDYLCGVRPAVWLDVKGAGT